jgi:hypothetical protein
MTNYSNWFAYYRTRVLAAKTTTAIAFNIIDNTYRAGFHTMNTPGTNWLNMADFDAAQRIAWYNMLFSIPITAGQRRRHWMRSFVSATSWKRALARCRGCLRTPIHSRPLRAPAGR